MAPCLDAIKRRRYVAHVSRGFGLWLLLLIASLVPHGVRARDMHLRLSRLSRGDCARTLPDAPDFALEASGAPTLSPDQAAYTQLVSQLAGALTPPLLAPVTTGGPSGFDIALDTAMTRIDDDASYWQRATAGGAASDCSGRNRDVGRALVSNRVRFNKGLPLGFSLGANVGMLHGLGLFTFGGELKLSLLEGATEPFRPSLAVRIASNALVGDAALSLSSSALDVLVSKEFSALHVLHLVPYLGLGAVLNYARSTRVDLTPSIDATACAAGLDPVCNAQGLGSDRADFAHDVAFKKILLMRYRAVLGLWLRYRAAAFAVEGSIDLLRPDQADRDVPAKTARQWSLTFAPSVSF